LGLGGCRKSVTVSVKFAAVSSRIWQTGPWNWKNLPWKTGLWSLVFMLLSSVAVIMAWPLQEFAQII